MPRHARARIRTSANVINPPLRRRRCAAPTPSRYLDLLSGGRVNSPSGQAASEDAIEAMSGSRLTAAESVEALGEAIEVIRALWDTETRGGVQVEGNHRVVGAKRGPAPARGHDLGGRSQAADAAAGGPGRGRVASQPAVRRRGAWDHRGQRRHRRGGRGGRTRPTSSATAPQRGSGDASPAFLTELALEHGVSAFILASDDPAVIERYGQEVARGARARRGRAARCPAAPDLPVSAAAATHQGGCCVTRAAPRTLATASRR